MNMDKDKKIVALLPMKANSERIKGKNFNNFCGKPLFRWVLDTLLGVERIDTVIINTDARSVLAENGLLDSDRVLLRDRPQEICGDLVSMNLIIENDVENVAADVYLMTHTTNPLLSVSSIEKALDQYFCHLEQGNDSLFTVNKIQTRFYDEACRAINHDPENLIRTQDQTPWFEENSNLYIFSKESFLKSKARIGRNPTMLVTDPYESSDIDTLSDWELAEAITTFYIGKGKMK